MDHEERSDPTDVRRGAFAEALWGQRRALAAACLTTAAVVAGTYLAVRAGGGSDRHGLVAMLMSMTGWTALAGAVAATGPQRLLDASFRVGTVTDTCGVILLVAALVSPDVTVLSALAIYLVLVSVGFFAGGVTRLARRAVNRRALAIVAAVVLAAALTTPAWVGGLLRAAEGSTRDAVAAWAVRINPIYPVTSAVAEEIGFVWHQAPVMYGITWLGDIATPPAAPWYSAAAVYAPLAVIFWSLAILRGRRARTDADGQESPAASGQQPPSDASSSSRS